MIGNEVVVEVIAISGEGVRLGISAPNETSVHRYEVFAEIQEANLSAEVVPNEIEQSVLENLSGLVRTKQRS